MALFAENSERKGLMGTLIVHGILLLLFLLLGLSYMVPPPPPFEAGVDFGFSETGMGDTENDRDNAEETAEQQSEPQSTPEEVTPVVDDAQTQDTEEAPVVKKEVPKEPVEKPVEKEPDPQPSEALKKLLEKRKNSGESGGSDGDREGPGNMGKPDGGDSDSYEGEPGSHDGLRGRYRKILEKVRPQADCPIGGNEVTVVMEIIVDRTGTVVRAKQVLGQSSTTDPCLVKRCTEAALKSRWNADAAAPPEQLGWFRYTFVPN